MKYIGKKWMWSTRRLKPLKGQKRKRKKVSESDWRRYYGSSAHLNEERDRIGDDKYGEVKTDADGNVDVDELEKYGGFSAVAS